MCSPNRSAPRTRSTLPAPRSRARGRCALRQKVTNCEASRPRESTARGAAGGVGGGGERPAGGGGRGGGARAPPPAWWGGGQAPVPRRTPKAKGFRNPFRVEYHVVNLDTLAGFDAGSTVDPATLRR